MITLYGFRRVTSFAHGRTRDLRALWALKEMDLPYRWVQLDHPAGELDTDSYRRINPFGQIPAIEDDGVIVSESGAVLLYLARKSGKLFGRDSAEQEQVQRWCFAALNTVELPMTFMDVLSLAEQQEAPTEQLRKMTRQLADERLQVVEAWMRDREFVATDEFTVADILMAHVLSEIEDHSLYEPYPHLRGYRERCKARAAWKSALDDYLGSVEPAD